MLVCINGWRVRVVASFCRVAAKSVRRRQSNAQVNSFLKGCVHQRVMHTKWNELFFVWMDTIFYYFFVCFYIVGHGTVQRVT